MVQTEKWLPYFLNVIISSLTAYSFAQPLLLISPILHTLTLYYHSYCYSGHCYRQSINSQSCQYCGLYQWTRMKHCKRCSLCVHKYDHHCYFMGICIGEFNQKYYLTFLYFHIFNCLYLSMKILQNIKFQVKIDNRGFETISWDYTLFGLQLIFLILNSCITLHLIYFHTYIAFTNQTSYQYHKREDIKYLKNRKEKMPFDRGVKINLFSVFTAKSSAPIKWVQHLNGGQQDPWI